MTRRTSLSVSLVAGIIAAGLFWNWALLATGDPMLVLDGRISLPVIGASVPARPALIAVPLLGLALLAFARPRGRWGGAMSAAIVVASLIGAFRGIELHDPALSYSAAGLAVLSALLAAWQNASGHRIRGLLRPGHALPALLACLAAAALGAVLLLVLIPWSIRGDLPKDLNNYPFGPAVRRLIFADLAGLERPGAAGDKDLRAASLAGADLSRSKLSGAGLGRANLFRARICWADLEGADLSGAFLSEALLSFSDLSHADFSGAKLNGIYAMGVDLRGAVLRGVGDHLLRFIYSDCRGADFASARLKGSTFFDSDCRGAIFRDADLTAAFLTRARLDGADLTGANLSGADLRQASLRGADLTGAVLGGVLLPGPEALAEARSLKGAVLDPPLREALERIRPGLF